MLAWPTYSNISTFLTCTVWPVRGQRGDRGNGLNFNWPVCHGEVSIWTVPSLCTSNSRNPAGPPGKLNLVRCTLSTFLCGLCSLWSSWVVLFLSLSLDSDVVLIPLLSSRTSIMFISSLTLTLKVQSLISIIIYWKQQRTYGLYNMCPPPWMKFRRFFKLSYSIVALKMPLSSTHWIFKGWKVIKRGPKRVWNCIFACQGRGYCKAVRNGLPITLDFLFLLAISTSPCITIVPRSHKCQPLIGNKMCQV